MTSGRSPCIVDEDRFEISYHYLLLILLTISHYFRGRNISVPTFSLTYADSGRVEVRTRTANRISLRIRFPLLYHS